MKLKLRLSTEQLVQLCKEMSDFLEATKGNAGFKRFYIHNHVREEGFFTFDLNIAEGFNHVTQKWEEGAATTLEIGTKKGFCFECAKRETLENGK